MDHEILVVGNGIAGCVLASTLHQQGYTVCLATDGELGSSSAAAGLINPVVIKRFNVVWKAEQMLAAATSFYKHIQKPYSHPFYLPLQILRVLHSEDEAKTWVKKSANDDLHPYLNQKIAQSSIDGIDAPHGYGQLKRGAKLDVQNFICYVTDFFRSKDLLLNLKVNQQSMDRRGGNWRIGMRHFKKVVFCDGAQIRSNPFFNYLPIQGNKGESLIIRVPGLQTSSVIKGPVFIMPYQDDMFWVGATYEREFEHARPTQAGLDKIVSMLDRFLKLDYEVVHHFAGIRPTVPDRRPILGAHPEIEGLFVFNGMGSRAALIAPWAAGHFLSCLQGDPLPEEIDVKRFERRWNCSSSAGMP